MYKTWATYSFNDSFHFVLYRTQISPSTISHVFTASLHKSFLARLSPPKTFSSIHILISLFFFTTFWAKIIANLVVLSVEQTFFTTLVLLTFQTKLLKLNSVPKLNSFPKTQFFLTKLHKFKLLQQIQTYPTQIVL